MHIGSPTVFGIENDADDEGDGADNIDGIFYGFISEVNHWRCWENTRKASKSRTAGDWFTSISRDLPTSQVGLLRRLTPQKMQSIAAIKQL